MISRADNAHFSRFGFVVLRRAFDPEPLSDEAIAHSAKARVRRSAPRSAVEVTGRYVPMMCERTPHSQSLLDHFADVAAELMASPVLPVRAKGACSLTAARTGTTLQARPAEEAAAGS